MNDINVPDRQHAHQGCTESARGAPKHPTKPWELDIDVYLTSVGPPAQFSIDTCLPFEFKDGDSHAWIHFHSSDRTAGFKLNFRLYDNTGAVPPYVFPNPPGNPKQGGDPNKWALWSSEGEGCPPEAAQWDQFTAQSVADQGTTLVVSNLNTYKTDFGYTLRVTNDNGKTFVNLDPGGTNYNGSSRF
jgi:hypothetical protein